MSLPGILLAPLVAAALLPVSHASDGAQHAASTEIVQTRTDANDRLTVPVRIGEHGPFRFLLDTGAQNTVVSSTLANQLALPAGQRATVIGVAGRKEVDTVEIDEIMLGKRSYFGLLAPKLEREHIGADGILGLDGLQNQRVLLDFGKNLIAVDDARNLGGDRGYEIVVRAHRKSGQLIMTNARIDGVKVDVVVDTGAEVTIGNLALQRALTARRVAQQRVAVHSVTGQVLEADLALTRKMALSDMTLTNVAIVYADAPPFAALDLAEKPALLLGMRELRMFDRVAIDFSTRRILFDLPKG